MATLLEILPDAEFVLRMNDVVIPYLADKKSSGSFTVPGTDTGPIYYERYRPRDPRSVLLMAHGFTESAEKYLELVYYFVQEGYAVYIFDQRGHGRSARTQQDLSRVHIESWAEYAADLLHISTVIAGDEHPDLPRYLYAHSMGGGVALAFLEMYPEIFEKAALSSPMIKPLCGGIPFGMAVFIADLHVLLGRGAHYTWGMGPFSGDETFEKSCDACRERFEYYHQKRCAHPEFQTNGATWAWLAEAGKLKDFILNSKNIAQLKTPMLLLQAADDTIVDTKANRAFVAAVEAAHPECSGDDSLISLTTIPGSKHEIFMSPDVVLKDFVSRILLFYEGA